MSYISQKLGIEINRFNFKALTAKHPLSTKNALFVLPQTYMNNSGEAVRAAMDYYTLDISQILVIYDDISLPCGKLRICLLYTSLPHGHYHYSCGSSTDSVFLHLLRHLQENDRNILELLSSENNEIFLKYFKSNLKKLILTQYADKGLLKKSILPEDYLVNHISSSFVETVDWWLSRKIKENPEEITEYFLAVIEPVLKN